MNVLTPQNQEGERKELGERVDVRMMRADECLEEVSKGIGPSWQGRPLYGASRSGLTPAKEAIGKHPERYKAVEPGTVFYNPMRILLGSIAMLDDGEEPGITSPDYVVVRGRPGVLHHRVFYYWLRSIAGQQLILDLARGGVRERILFNRLCEGEIPVAPWPAQQRIAQQLAIIPRARAAAQSRLAVAEALPAAYLDEVFERAEWPAMQLGDGLARFEAGTSVVALGRPAEEGEWGVLKVSAVSWSEFNPRENKAVPPGYVPAKHERVRTGDLIISRANTAELAGAIVLVRETPDNLMLSDKTLRLVLKPEVFAPEFLQFALRCRTARRFIESNATGTSYSMRNISQPTMRAIPLPMPPLADQRRIAADLSNRLAAAERLTAEIRAELAAIEALPAALLREAFAAPAAEPIIDITQQGDFVPASSTNPANFFRRGAIAAYIVNRLHHLNTFGRVHLEKNLYLSEAFVGVDLGGQYKRKAAGPLDADFLYKLESIAAKQQWFTKHRRGAEGYFYRPGNDIGGRLGAAEKILGDRRNTMDKLLDLTAKLDTERVEIVATLFAAWNDRLIAGEKVDDALVVQDVRERWNVSKQRFSVERLQTAMQWMRDNSLVPTGIGPRTSIG